VHNDTQRKVLLLSKMTGWKELECTLNTIRAQPMLTYQECKDLLTTLVDRLVKEGILASKQAKAMALQVNPLLAHQAEMDRVMQQSVNDVTQDQLYGEQVMQQRQLTYEDCIDPSTAQWKAAAEYWAAVSNISN